MGAVTPFHLEVVHQLPQVIGRIAALRPAKIAEMVIRCPLEKRQPLIVIIIHLMCIALDPERTLVSHLAILVGLVLLPILNSDVLLWFFHCHPPSSPLSK